MVGRIAGNIWRDFSDVGMLRSYEQWLRWYWRVGVVLVCPALKIVMLMESRSSLTLCH